MFIEKKYPPERICLWNMETGSWMEIDMEQENGKYSIAIGNNADYREIYSGEKQRALKVYEHLKMQWTANRNVIQMDSL